MCFVRGLIFGNLASSMAFSSWLHTGILRILVASPQPVFAELVRASP